MIHRGRSLLLVVACLLTVPGQLAGVLAADPQPYDLTIQPSGDGALDDALKNSAQLDALRQKAPVGPFALVARAKADIPRFETALHSDGYYDGHVAIRFDGRDMDDPDLLEALRTAPAEKPVAVSVTVDKGTRYRLGTVAVAGDCPADIAGKIAVAAGQPAVAADVLAARSRLLAALQDDGYALAAVDPPAAVADEQAKTIDVTFTVAAGRRMTIGPIRIEGASEVSEDYIRRRLEVHSGELYRASRIEAARADLASLGVFSAVAVRTGAAADAEDRIALIFSVQERAKHVVGLTAAYSTDLGAMPKVTWSDRNLFGAAEQLNLSAAATGLSGSATKGLGYNLTGQLIKPDFLRRDQSLEFDLGALKQSLEAYDQDAVTAGTSLHRTLNARWSASVGLSFETERILQEGVSRSYHLIGLPVGAIYDSTGQSNPLLDPTHGMRAAATLTPYESFGHTQASFVTAQLSGSVYLDMAGLGLASPGRSIIALKGLVGGVEGATTFQLPPDQRFYGGGSGTVRGFSYQSVGPQFADGKPQGGTAIDAGTVEFRQRLWGDFGAAVFIDAGQVSDAAGPFEGALRIGAGGGLRYYTSIGTVRADIALPVNRPVGGDTFELYVGLGQAF